MDAGAEGREDADPPVADLVPEPLDRHRPVGRQGAGVVPLLVDVGEEVRRGVRVERSLFGQEAARVVRVPAAELTQERAQRPAQFHRPARTVAVPEGHPSRFAGSGPHDDPVAGDIGHPPGRGAEQEGVPGTGLVNHLLVQLAESRSVGPEVDREHAAVGNRAGVHPHEQGCPAPGRQHTAPAVPGQARPQVGELLRRIPADQHVEHRGEHAAGQAVVRAGPPRHGKEIVDAPLPVAAHRDDLLSQHVERVLGHPHRLDRTALHLHRRHGALQQVAAELGEDQAAAALADRMTGAAHALQTSRGRAGRLDQQHLVDRAHVDPEFERARGDDAAQATGLERLLDLPPLLVGDAAVVSPGQRLHPPAR